MKSSHRVIEMWAMLTGWEYSCGNNSRHSAGGSEQERQKLGMWTIHGDIVGGRGERTQRINVLNTLFGWLLLCLGMNISICMAACPTQ